MQFSLTAGFVRFLLSLLVTVGIIGAAWLAWHMLHMVLPTTQGVAVVMGQTAVAIIIVILIILYNRSKLRRMQSREADVRASQQKFEHVYKSSPVPYVNLDESGTIVLTNLAAIRLFGVPAKRILGKKLADFLHHDDENALLVLLSKLDDQTSVSEVETKVHNQQLGDRWILLSVFPFGTEGERLVSLFDVTRQKEVEEAKTEFVTLASHQLRTPIASIRWNTELLASATPNMSPEQTTYHEKIDHNIERLVSLVTDFLNVSRLELGTFSNKYVPVEIDTFLTTTIEEFSEVIERKRVVIKTDYDERVPVAELDERLLHIIFGNLLSNAIKYTPEGGMVSVATACEQEYLVVRITDTGMGIPRSEQKSMFTKFYRASNARDYTIEGTGLGLYLVKKAVAMLGGTVTVDSIEQKGSTFTVSIPM